MATAQIKWPNVATITKRVLVSGKLAPRYPISIETTGSAYFGGYIEQGQVIHGKKTKGGSFRFPLSQSDNETMVCEIEPESFYNGVADLPNV